MYGSPSSPPKRQSHGLLPLLLLLYHAVQLRKGRVDVHFALQLWRPRELSLGSGSVPKLFTVKRGRATAICKWAVYPWLGSPCPLQKLDCGIKKVKSLKRATTICVYFGRIIASCRIRRSFTTGQPVAKEFEAVVQTMTG